MNSNSAPSAKQSPRRHPSSANLRNLALAELRAATDGLTGLPNKRSLQDMVRRMVAHSARTFTPLSALMCDLDHFKHDQRPLRTRQRRQRARRGRGRPRYALRASDFAARYGGEEFVVLLPDTDAAVRADHRGKAPRRDRRDPRRTMSRSPSR